MIRITPAIAINESEISERFVRSSGPGGQNVNKVASAVQRLARLAGRRLTHEGVLVITAQRHRTQEANRRDALDRLVELIRRAAEPPVPRRPTKPTAASRRRRLEAKSRRSALERCRSSRGEE